MPTSFTNRLHAVLQQAPPGSLLQQTPPKLYLVAELTLWQGALELNFPWIYLSTRLVLPPYSFPRRTTFKSTFPAIRSVPTRTDYPAYLQLSCCMHFWDDPPNDVITINSKSRCKHVMLDPPIACYKKSGLWHTSFIRNGYLSGLDLATKGTCSTNSEQIQIEPASIRIVAFVAGCNINSDALINARHTDRVPYMDHGVYLLLRPLWHILVSTCELFTYQGTAETNSD